MKNIVYVNGSFVDAGKAFVSVFDRGFNYGDGLFETMKANQGKVIFLKEHLTRLKEEAKVLGISGKAFRTLATEIKKGAIVRLLRLNGLMDRPTRIRLTLTRGVDMNAFSPSPRDLHPTSIITALPLDSGFISKAQKSGLKAVTIRGFAPALPGIKSLNFLPNILGKAYARKLGAAEGIFVGKDRSISEGTTTNIFLVVRGVIKTPPLKNPYSSEGVLPGVMRKTIFDIAARSGLKVVESPLFLKDLKDSTEGFLTNSILEIAPLISVDMRPLGDGRPGPVTRGLQGLLPAVTR